MKTPPMLRLSELKDKKKTLLIPVGGNEVNAAVSTEKRQQGKNKDIQ